MIRLILLNNILVDFHLNTISNVWKQEVNGDEVEDGDIEHRNYENYFIFSFQEQQLYTLLLTQNVDSVLRKDKLRLEWTQQFNIVISNIKVKMEIPLHKLVFVCQY